MLSLLISTSLSSQFEEAPIFEEDFIDSFPYTSAVLFLVGGTIGSCVILFLLACFCCKCLYRRKKQSIKVNSASNLISSYTPNIIPYTQQTGCIPAVHNGISCYNFPQYNDQSCQTNYQDQTQNTVQQVNYLARYQDFNPIYQSQVDHHIYQDNLNNLNSFPVYPIPPKYNK